MDNLARDAMIAKQRGLSYGQLKAIQEPVKIAPKPEIPEGWKVCKGCGKAFKPNTKQRLYCDITCRTEVYNETHRERRLERAKIYRENRKAKLCAEKD